MKVIVLTTFHASDSYDNVFEAGKEYELEDNRALALIERGLVSNTAPSPMPEEADAEKAELFPAKKTKKNKE